MRRRLVFATATLLCCGFSSLASGQLELTASPTLAPPLHLAQSSSSDTPNVGDSDDRPSPFDIFADAAPNALQMPQAIEEKSEENTTPVGRHHRSAPAGGTVQVAPVHNHNYAPPVDYASHQRRTPNLVANYMSREWCVDGLWDNYSAERAAQCARQAEIIAGRQHCGHCGSAGACGQPACEQPSCQPVINRYRQQGGHCGNFGHGKFFGRGNSCGQPNSCGSCGQAGSSCSPCDGQPESVLQSQPSGCAQTSPGHGEQAPTQYALTQPGPNGRPTPMDLPPPPQKPMSATGKVAFQPLNLIR